MWHILVPGVQYEGETDEQMERREKAMQEHNRRMDELATDWERQRRTPMPAMQEWAQQHGVLPNV